MSKILLIGSALPNWFESVFQLIGNLLNSPSATFVVEKLSSLILAPLNVILWIAFKATTIFTNLAYNIMRETVLITPIPENEDGAVIFADPSPTDPFLPMQEVIQNGIVPVSILFIIFGIIAVMFFRVFDVVIDTSFSGEKAQRRLLLAPLLITLWVPIANMILTFAVGITEFFAPNGPVASSMTVDQIFEQSEFDAFEGRINVMGLLESVPENEVGDGPLTFITEDGVNSAITLTVGLFFSLFIIPVATIALLLAFIRIFLLYILYVLGPLGIMMWALTWRDIGDLGEKIVRYFILLALFPIPAAIVATLLPVVAVGVEQAILGAVGEISGGAAGTGLSSGNLIRGVMVGVIVTIIGFAPWAIVIGVGKATALAGTAAAAGGAVATGGTAAIAGAGISASSSMTKGVASKVASGASSANETIGATDKIKSKADDVVNSTTGAENAAELRNNISERQNQYRNRARERMQDNAAGRIAMSKGADMKDTAKSTVGEFSEEMGEMSKERVASVGMDKLGDGMRTAGFRNTADVLDRSSKAMKSHRKRKEKIRKKKNKEKAKRVDKKLHKDLPEGMGEKELEAIERMSAEDLSKNEVKQMVATSDKIDYTEDEVDQLYNSDGSFREDVDEDAKRSIGSALVREVHDADQKQDLVEEGFGPDMANSMTNAVQQDPDRESLIDVASEMDSVSESDVINGRFEMDEYANSEVEGANPLTAHSKNRWVFGDDEFDKEKHDAAVSQLEDKSEDFRDNSVTRAVQSVEGVEDEAESDIVGGLEDVDMTEAYQDGNLREEVEVVVENQGDEMFSDDLDEDELKEAKRDLTSKMVDQYEQQVETKVKNSGQIQLNPTIDDVNRLPDDVVEESIQGVTNAEELVSEETDVQVDTQNLINEDDIQEQIAEELGSVDMDANMDDIAAEISDSDAPEEIIRNAIDEDMIEARLDGTKFTQNLDELGIDESEVTGEIRSAIAEDMSKNAEVISEDMAKMTSDALEQMNEETLNEIKTQYESTVGEMSVDITEGELSPQDIQDMGTEESMSVVKGAIEETRQSVLDDIESRQNLSGDQQEKAVETINNLSPDDVMELSSSDNDTVQDVIDKQDPMLDDME